MFCVRLYSNDNVVLDLFELVVEVSFCTFLGKKIVLSVLQTLVWEKGRPYYIGLKLNRWNVSELLGTPLLHS